jgi:hypothetical protein
VHKVQHKSRKKSSLGLNLKRSKELEWAENWRTGLFGVPPDSVQCTRAVHFKPATLENSRAPSAIIHRTVRCATRLSGEPAEQRLSAPTVDFDRRNNAAKYRAEVRAAKSEWHRTIRFRKKTKIQRSTELRTLTVG